MKIIPIRPQPDRTKRCVISLGVGRSAYIQCLTRLEQSLRRVGFAGDFLVWSNELPAGSPSQFEAPMAFKTFCFYEALKHGYQEVLWIDAPIVALRRIEPIFKLLDDNGYVTFTNNYDQSVGQWSGDDVLSLYQMSRDEAMLIPETPTSVIGLDLESTIGKEFLARWHAMCLDGVTCRGTVKPIRSPEDHYAIAWNKENCISKDPRVGGHRFDQTAAGIIAHQLGLPPYADSLRDIHYKKTRIDLSTVLLHHREFGETITPLEKIIEDVFWRTPFYKTPKAKISQALSKLKSSAKTIIGR